MRTIKARLLSLLFLLLIALVVVAGVGWYAAQTANNGLDAVFQDSVRPLRELKSISDHYAVDMVDTAHKVRNGSVKWEAGAKLVEEPSRRAGRHQRGRIG